MIFNHYNYFNYFNEIKYEADAHIKNNDLGSLKKLLRKYPNLATAKVPYGFSDNETLFHKAITSEKDDIALELYVSSPNVVKNYMISNNLNNLRIYSDILGDAVFHNRLELVKMLLELKGKYEFDIDGVKKTNNHFLNFYHIRVEDFTDEDIYITSPLLISMLINDWEMYKCLKNKGAYFNIKNSDCKFHFERCNESRIKEDIMGGKYEY